MFMAASMKPRSKTSGAASPISAWDAYKKSRWVLRALGCLLSPLDKVRKTLKGLLRSYVLKYDDAVLAPKRKQSFSRAQEARMQAILESAAIPGWTAAEHNMILDAIRVSRCSGARKAELCLDGGDHHFTRAHVLWYIGNKEVEPTIENIMRANRVVVIPTASKADPINMFWGSYRITFDLIEGEHMSAALALKHLELAFPCAVEDRRKFPLVFDPSKYARGGPPPPAVSRSWLTRRFATLLREVMDEKLAAERSWHSWRVTLACSLRAAVDKDHPE